MAFQPLEKTPRLFGVYDEVNYSSYNGGYEYTATATIRQTLSSITIIEEADRSGHAESIAASLVKNSPDGARMLY